jgi:hypothetical protein
MGYSTAQRTVRAVSLAGFASPPRVSGMKRFRISNHFSHFLQSEGVLRFHCWHKKHVFTLGQILEPAP